ncbi:MAG: metallophosphoesterase family protein [Chloroflexi bacterium]|nr:metallophosphoesterase family protein [Chloroflexota bacterium]
MMRIAVLSDIHGNLPALKAVLTDIQAQGAPDTYLVLGDLAVFCPWPTETLDKLRALPNVSFLQGNTDRYLVTGQRPVHPVCSPEDWTAMPTRLAEREANFLWTVDRLSYADYEFLRDLPPRLEMDVPGYGRVVAVHATPTDDETVILPDTPDDEIRPHLAGLDARLLLYGHTHRPLDRTVDGVRIVNDGSVGIPLDGTPLPSYTLVDFKGDQCEITGHRVVYDRSEVIAELKRVEHPGVEWVPEKLLEASP